ncbi:MAG: sigma-70 family RNA polymerase sigma factor [Prevotella sp.]
MKRDKAFEEFFRNNFERLNLYALHLVNDEELSRDIVSDAMEYVWKNYSSRDDVGWYRYCMSFVRNRCIDHLRRQSVHQRYVDFIMHVVERDDTPYGNADDERLGDIMRVMDTLTPKTRLVLQECYLQHRTYKEVAEELEISVSGVKKHIMTALRIMREKISKKYKKE